MPPFEYFDSNNYEFNPESRNGVYIIHGFTNTTCETRDLAKYLGDRGFYSVANNLPGHGTTVEDCNRCKFLDWINFVEQGVAEMSSKCDNVYVVGISMGSVLALHLSTVFPLNAVVFGATVLKFKNYIGTRLMTPIFHKIVTTRDVLKRWTKLGYKEKIHILIDEYYLSHSRVEDIIQEK